MAVHIDRKFLYLLSPKLERFVQKKTDLYNFRCPYCGDSSKKSYKTRGYVYRKKNDYFFKCHNCGESHTFYNFIKDIDPTLLKEYTLDRYRNGEDGNQNYPKHEFSIPTPVFDHKPPVFSTRPKLDLDSIKSLPDGHFAKDYVIGREIPETKWNDIYFAPEFYNFIETLNVETNELPNDPRLIIPFFDRDKKLTMVQGRSLGSSKALRYITIKIDEDADKIYGLDSVDTTKKVYVVEGPIDSMFLNNAVATADANLSHAGALFDDVTLIFDNEPRNKELVQQIKNALDKDFPICLFPDTIHSKDINEMIVNGISPERLHTIIEQNTFSGLRAQLEFTKWKKC